MDIAADTSADVSVLRYRVEGMDCPSCASKIETGLGRLDGTGEIRVSYHKQSLALRLDEARTPRDALEAKVRALGFGISQAFDPTAPGATALLMEADIDAGVSEQQWWQNGKVRWLALIGGLLVAGYAVDWMVPGLRGWATLPAALVGLSAAIPRALILARSGSPFSIEMLMSVTTLGALLIGAPAEGATVVFLFTAGEVMEGIAAGRARAGVSALTATVPRTAWLVEEEGVRPVPVAVLKIGQIVLVRPGDRVPVDGIVVDGASALDESPVTGEFVPVPRGEGDRLLAGSVNGDGGLHVRATSLAADNTIARIINMVEEAQASRAPTARFIERFSAAYTPVAVVVAVLAAILPPLLFGADWTTWTYRGLALLLIGCPCALVLSTPAAVTAGIAAGARRGLLIKGGATLEAIGRVRTIAFDKTGTLTEGEPRITDVLALSGNERSVLALAASVEKGSSHPLARAIADRAAADGIPLCPVGNSRAIRGHAATAIIAGKEVTVGSPRYAAAEYGPLPQEVNLQILTLEAEGKTVVLVLSGGEVKGLIAMRDEPRADAAAAVRDLERLGIRSVMLTGDNRRTSAALGKALGLDARSELLPEDKLRAIGELKAQAPVAMVGDGMNDGPALAAASVGIAMGGGADVALETADAALLGGRLAGVPALVRLSRATMRNIHQNVAIALGLKSIFLVTTLAGITGLWPAILADTGATVIVTLNALRLLRYR